MNALHGTCTQASLPPLCNHGAQEITYGHAFASAKQYVSRITASHFSTLNMKIANQNVLNIAMHNKNKADCKENFRICAEGPIAHLDKQ